MLGYFIIALMAAFGGMLIGYAAAASKSATPPAAKPSEPTAREVVEVPVIGDPLRVKLYEATRRARYGDDTSPPNWHGNVYTSCEQAHSECPGAEVSAFEAIRIGSHYFRAWAVKKVQPKPKRAKGKR